MDAPRMARINAVDYAKFFSRSHHAAFSKKTGSTPGASKTSGDFADPLAVSCGSLNALD